MGIVEASKLSISYGEHNVVRDIDFEVKQGEMISIIGPNGSGKSTVLKVLSKLLHAETGTVLLDQKRVSETSHKELAKKVGFLLQTNIAPEDLTVRDLVYFGRLPHKKWFESKTEKDREKVEEMLMLADLSKLGDKKVYELSGGERQRAWLAVALAQEPKVLLLDEPTTYLDIGYQLELLELIRELNHRLRITVIMVLHDLNQAAKYSDRLLVIKNKSIVAHGTPEKVLTPGLLSEVYGVSADIIRLENGDRVVIPMMSNRRKHL